jgi:hypothetical protein
MAIYKSRCKNGSSRIISELSGNEYLQDILNSLQHLVDLTQISNFIAELERMADALTERRGIDDAMQQVTAAMLPVWYLSILPRQLVSCQRLSRRHFGKRGDLPGASRIARKEE